MEGHNGGKWASYLFAEHFFMLTSEQRLALWLVLTAKVFSFEYYILTNIASTESAVVHIKQVSTQTEDPL